MFGVGVDWLFGWVGCLALAAADRYVLLWSSRLFVCSCCVSSVACYFIWFILCLLVGFVIDNCWLVLVWVWLVVLRVFCVVAFGVACYLLVGLGFLWGLVVVCEFELVLFKFLLLWAV